MKSQIVFIVCPLMPLCFLCKFKNTISNVYYSFKTVFSTIKKTSTIKISEFLVYVKKCTQFGFFILTICFILTFSATDKSGSDCATVTYNLKILVSFDKD